MRRIRRTTLMLTIIGSMLAASLLSAADGSIAAYLAEEEGYAPAPAARDLLENGDFETGTADPWEAHEDIATDQLQTVASAVYGQMGKFAYQISAPYFEWQYEMKYIAQTVPVHPGEQLQLTADLFITHLDNALITLRIEYLDKNGQQLEGRADERNIYRELDDSNIGTLLQERLAVSAPDNAAQAKIYIILKAREAGGSGSIIADNIALTAEWSPRLLTAADITDTSIKLAWQPPAGDVAAARYHITQDSTVIGAVYGEVTEYTVTGLRPAAEYRFEVTAETEQGSLSAPSQALVAVTAKSPGSTTIMPLGASMTYGKFYEGGYRGFLWQNLRQANLDANLVGSKRDNPFGVIGGIEPDNDHEGHGDSGYTVEQLTELAKRQVDLYKPDIMLIFTGTNDMFSAGRAAAAADDVPGLIEAIHGVSPDTQIILSSIAPMTSDPDVFAPRISAYNERLEQIVADYQSSGHKVGFVDTHALMKEDYFPYAAGDPIQDGIHPGREAFQVMGDIWYDAVQAIMTQGHVSHKNPTRPAGLAHAFNGNGSVTIAWEASTDNIAVGHYEIRTEDDELVGITNDTSYTTNPLLADTLYTYKVTAVDTSANRSPESSITFKTAPRADTTPPDAPAYVNIYDFTHNALMIEWHASPDDDIAEYRVLLGDHTYATTDTKLTIEGLEPLTTYTVTVAAVDAAGNMSVDNRSAVEMTLPSPVSDLRIAEQSSSYIRIEWAPSAESKVVGYEIAVNGEYKDTVYEDAFYLHDGLSAGQELSYQVAAIDNLGRRSLASSPVQATVGKPNKPERVEARSITDSSVELAWAPVSGAVKYEVQFTEGTRRNEWVAASNSHTVTQLKPSTRYQVGIAAIDGAGNRSDEAIIEVTTTAARTNGGSYYGGGASPSAGSTEKEAVYTEEEDRVKLIFTPSERSANEQLNGSGSSYTIEIPDDEAYHTLELRLSGKIVRAAATADKRIVIAARQWMIEWPASGLAADDGDTVKLIVKPAEPAVWEAADAQSLIRRSDAYHFSWLLNDQPIEPLPPGVQLTLYADGIAEPERSGMFHYDEPPGRWSYIGGQYAQDGGLTAKLIHFSIYGTFESRKTFDDIAEHWARADIEALAAKQIISGITDQRFDPEGDVTRAQFAAMLTRALKLVPRDRTLPFKDVPEHAWYADDIRAAYQNGIIKGMNDDRFAPNERITREQMAIMIMNAYLYATSGSMDQFEHIDEVGYADEKLISTWSLDQVRAASSLGLLQGADGYFHPGQLGSRAQAAAVINRLLKLLA